jgi:hypothetical protein
MKDRAVCTRWRIVLIAVFSLTHATLAAEPLAPALEPTQELWDEPMCGMHVLMLQVPAPSAEEVGIPVPPGAFYRGATGPGSGEANGETFAILASVFLLTSAEPDEVAAFYAEALDESWQQGEIFGSHVFYQHEPVIDVVDLLFERPGALPVVEIVEVWSDCDRLLLPEAQTAIRLYYPP